MRLLLLPFLLSLCAPLHAGVAVLWIPRQHSGIDDVLLKLEADPNVKLTAAFSEAPAGAAARINALCGSGRLELAARPAGDPVMPLFYYPKEESVPWQNKPSTAAFSNDPYFLALRLSDARDAFIKTFKKPPEGLAAAPGGLIAEYLPLAKALGFRWLAAGPLVSTAPFAAPSVDGVIVAPFSFSSSTPPAGADFFAVFDETLDRPQPGGTRERLLAFLGSGLYSNYLTVSEALKAAVSTPAAAGEIPAMVRPWSGDYTPWAAGRIQAGTLGAFARTRADLMLYLNSKQGDYRAARNAFAEYFAVESGPKLLRLLDEDPEAVKETEIEIQSAVGNAYRLMEKTPPGWLVAGLADISVQAGGADIIAVTRSSSSFAIRNASRQPVPPERMPDAPKAADPGRIWKLDRFGASWSDNAVTFSFAPLALVSAPAGEGGFALARFDLYIDINHRPRAGSTRPLDGRDVRLFPDDAWEYALEIAPKKAALYAATPGGPYKTAIFRPEVRDGAVTVRIPRSFLKGNPGNWGYAAFMLAQKDTLFSVSDYIVDDFSSGYFYMIRPRMK